jgi:hypothetical protein
MWTCLCSCCRMEWLVLGIWDGVVQARVKSFCLCANCRNAVGVHCSLAFCLRCNCLIVSLFWNQIALKLYRITLALWADIMLFSMQRCRKKVPAIFTGDWEVMCVKLCYVIMGWITCVMLLWVGSHDVTTNSTRTRFSRCQCGEGWFSQCQADKPSVDMFVNFITFDYFWNSSYCSEDYEYINVLFTHKKVCETLMSLWVEAQKTTSDDYDLVRVLSRLSLKLSGWRILTLHMVRPVDT